MKKIFILLLLAMFIPVMNIGGFEDVVGLPEGPLFPEVPENPDITSETNNGDVPPVVKVSEGSLSEYVYWDSTMVEYNCYGFAIGVKDKVDPGYKSGNMSIDYLDNRNNLAFVTSDLISLGYTNVREVNSTYRPVNSKEFLIAFRTGEFVRDPDETDYTIPNGRSDYHFMKYDQVEDRWLHKPGGSAIIKLKDNRDITSPWPFEYYKPEPGTDYVGWFKHEHDGTYNTELIFVAYEAYDIFGTDEILNLPTQSVISGNLNISQNTSNYAYAIEEIGNKLPGYTINPWQPSYGLNGLKSRVIIDLVDLGYDNIREVNSRYRPIASNEKLIAFRIGSFHEYDIVHGTYNTIERTHFMRYDYLARNWYHTTDGIYETKLISSTYITRNWLHEYYHDDVDPRNDTWRMFTTGTYDGQIIYIAYEESGPGSVMF